MKKIMMALMILGMCHFAADAKTKGCPAAKKAVTHKVAAVHKTHTLKLTKAYQVCKEQGGYYTCCVYKTNGATPLLR